jgi:hypothetical protein
MAMAKTASVNDSSLDISPPLHLVNFLSHLVFMLSFIPFNLKIKKASMKEAFYFYVKVARFKPAGG